MPPHGAIQGLLVFAAFPYWLIQCPSWGPLGWTNNVRAPLQCQHIKQATIRTGSFSSRQLLAAIILLIKFHSGKYWTDINQVSQPLHPIEPKPLWPLKIHQTVARTHLLREDRSSGQPIEIYTVLATFQPIFFFPRDRRSNRDLSDNFARGLWPASCLGGASNPLHMWTWSSKRVSPSQNTFPTNLLHCLTFSL